MHTLSPIVDNHRPYNSPHPLVKLEMHASNIYYIYLHRCAKSRRQCEYHYCASFAGKGEMVAWGIKLTANTKFIRPVHTMLAEFEKRYEILPTVRI